MAARTSLYPSYIPYSDLDSTRGRGAAGVSTAGRSPSPSRTEYRPVKRTAGSVEASTSKVASAAAGVIPTRSGSGAPTRHDLDPVSAGRPTTRVISSPLHEAVVRRVYTATRAAIAGREAATRIPTPAPVPRPSISLPLGSERRDLLERPVIFLLGEVSDGTSIKQQGQVVFFDNKIHTPEHLEASFNLLKIFLESFIASTSLPEGFIKEEFTPEYLMNRCGLTFSVSPGGIRPFQVFSLRQLLGLSQQLQLYK